MLSSKYFSFVYLLKCGFSTLTLNSQSALINLRPLIVLMLWLGFASQAFSLSISIGPYLQNATPNSIVIMWETDTGDESRLSYGLTSALGLTQTGTSMVGNGVSRIHTVQLTGLTPDTEYHYKVSTGSASSATYHFHTMSADVESDTNFMVYSDMQEQGGAAKNIHGRIINESVPAHVPGWTGQTDLADGIDFVLVPGDMVANGHDYSHWKNQFFDEAGSLISLVPYFTALGNHERNSPFYYKFMDNPSNGSATNEEQWYEFDHANIKVITLNTNNASADVEQFKWLDGVLANACIDDSIDFVFAQFHHAHISETWLSGQSNTAAELVERLVGFSKSCNKASVHFYGHSHSYQRGQVRDHAHFYMDVSGAEGDLAYWGQYRQANSDVIQKSIVEWGWSFVQVTGGSDPKFIMRRIGLGGEDNNYILNFPGRQIDEIVYQPTSTPPLQPTVTTPKNNAQVSNRNIVLQASPFVGQQAGATHLASHFQITTTSGDYTSPVTDQWFRAEDRYFKVNINAGLDLTRNKDAINLTANTTYYWRARYRDSGFKWSAWSAEAAFEAKPCTSNCESTATISTGKNIYLVGEDVPVVFSNAPGNTTDWIGVYPKDVAPGGQSAITWRYLNNTTTAPSTAIIGGLVSFSGLTKGEWDIHLLENNGYTSLHKITISVSTKAASTPQISTSQSIYQVGDIVTVSFKNAPGNTSDWIGVYPRNISPGSQGAAAWKYLNNTTSVPTVAITDGSIALSGLAQGGWDIHLLENNGYTSLHKIEISISTVSTSER